MADNQSRDRGKDERAGTEMERRERGAMVGREPYGTGPFALMRSFSEEMDRMFSDFLGLRRGRPRGGSLAGLGGGTFWPDMEVFQRGNKLVVRADTPGVERDDLDVEVREGALVISGERMTQNEQEDDRFFRRERSYGSFQRTIPLPEGANTENIQATFQNGVLEVEVELEENTPSRGRRIEVREGARATAGAGRHSGRETTGTSSRSR
jgi:HSP20 family protein